MLRRHLRRRQGDVPSPAGRACGARDARSARAPPLASQASNATLPRLIHSARFPQPVECPVRGSSKGHEHWLTRVHMQSLTALHLISCARATACKIVHHCCLKASRLESQWASEPESQRAREPECQSAREPGAREPESQRAREPESQREQSYPTAQA